MAVKKNFLQRVALILVPLVYVMLSGLLFATCRITHNGSGAALPGKKKKQKGQFIFAFWHYGLFYVIHRFRRRHGVAMVSGSKDGEYIARLMHLLGYKTVRGSRHKGGLGAIRDMVKIMKKEGREAGIVADGSQGPSRQVQAGVILLASRTGVPIMPLAWAASRYFVFNSWDRTALPHPFAKLSMWYGEPMTVPGGLKARDLEKYRLELENRLNSLYEEAWAEFGKEGH